MKNEITDFCNRHEITEDQFYGREKISGYLYLGSVTTLPEGFNPTVGGSLYLGSVTTLPEGFNPTVGEYLDLGSVTTLPEGFNPTVGGSLYLGSVTTLPEGFNPTVGEYLDLGSVTTLPEGFNPTVGEYLDLGSVTTLPEGFKKSDYERKPVPPVEATKLITWGKGKYIKCDGHFSEVIQRKGNVWKLKDLNKTKEYYLVTDNNGRYAHGDTIKEAKEDLIYKISERNKDQYKGIDLNKKRPFNECIEMYRVITGACSTGTKHFVESHSIPKKSYSVTEMIKVTKGQYGNADFAKFFNQ